VDCEILAGNSKFLKFQNFGGKFKIFKIFMWLDSPSKVMQSCKITFSRKRLSQELQEIKVSKSTGGTKANFSEKKFFF
jgi:hypothetical protein